MNQEYWSVNRIILTILLFLSLGLLAQAQKHDHIWMNGWDAKYGGIFGNFTKDFRHNPMDMFPIDFGEYANYLSLESSISNTEGELLLSCQGCRVFNRNGIIVPDSENMNPGAFHNSYCKNNNDYPCPFCIIPFALNDSQVVLLHYGLDYPTKLGLSLRPLYKTLLGIQEDSIFIMSINEVVSTKHLEMMHAVKHANGRDWWIIAPIRNTNQFSIFLMDNNGYISEDSLNIGFVYTFKDCGSAGIQTSSPDGRYYVRYNNTCGLSFFDFDRCTGTLSNERLILLPEVFFPGAFTVFSPDSRYCYYNSSRVIMQVDMEDPFLIPDTVAIVDSFPSDFGAGFNMMQRGPDGRIYISTGSSNKARHVIHYPDVKGPDCWVQPSGVPTPHLTRPLPNIPNYRLGVLAGSPCDTLGLSNSVDDLFRFTSLRHRIYPNPVSNSFFLELDDGQAHNDPWILSVMNMLGQTLYVGYIPPYAYLHQVSSIYWEPGLYFYTIQNSVNEIIGGGKIIKQ